ncbi:MAG: FAD-dependent oxidoreductase, partial [Thermoleophilia bacterium]|nr:FAD-dependent oxidoreductase [Thermoleophilia bacterium]
VDVTVLEASSRTGGRTWTRDTLGVPVDMGASWIEGADHNPTMSIVRSAGIRTVVSEDDVAVYADGDRVADADISNALRRFGGALERARAWAEDVPDTDPSLDRALRSTGTDLRRADGLLQLAAVSELDDECAASAAELSAWNYDSDDALDGDFLLLPGGYVQVVKQLATGLEIEHEVEVTRIRSRASGGALVTARDGREWSADRVVVAVPLTQLRELRFVPALPAAHRTSMYRLGMGTFNKVALRFDERFWPDVDTVAIGDRRSIVREWLNMERVVGEPVLLGLAGGDAGRWVEAHDDRTVRRRVLAEMSRAAGVAVPDPTGIDIQRWGSEPFIGGSYSYRPPGASMADHAALAEPIDVHVALAGEATDPEFPSTVHGAIRSGRRAARDVLRARVN